MTGEYDYETPVPGDTLNDVDWNAIPSGPEFMEWWRRLPRNGHAIAPRIEDYLDQPKPEFAPWVVVVDVGKEDRLPIRLFGTGLAESFGELTKQDYLDYMPPPARRAIGISHRTMATLPCGRLTLASAITTGGRDVVLGIVSLPLSSRGEVRHMVKLTRIIDQLDFREGLTGVNRVFAQSWLDLGAGIPRDSQT